MRDGSLVCIGKGNPIGTIPFPTEPDGWWAGAPQKKVSLFRSSRRQWRGSIPQPLRKSTIDEAPFAYKPMDEIVSNITDTAEIIKIIKPVYNFKAAE